MREKAFTLKDDASKRKRLGRRKQWNWKKTALEEERIERTRHSGERAGRRTHRNWKENAYEREKALEGELIARRTR